jgi:hypothetical protein
MQTPFAFDFLLDTGWKKKDEENQNKEFSAQHEK